ncbi:Mce protein [Mycobacterium sp. PS03-16]|uniref:Mce protein n=1 Tax=Mycobacterium sp. PS03-16 TaxID=2559611 RepID=UPI0010737D5C|nr:Mce protein [Mycobacterium sp. PS03-16]TFV55556.1 Mce protein [Mycobacterium sp. PS03-16]
MGDDALSGDGAPVASEAGPDPSDVAPQTAAEDPAGDRSPLRWVLIAGLAVVVALAGLTGWLGYRAHQQQQDDAQREVFLQVGRQAAQNLTSIDWEQAEADVQRVLDVATGTFYDDFHNRAEPFIEVVREAKSRSVGTLGEAGIESMSGDQATVLVAVTVTSSNAGAPEQAPRAWRMRLTVQRVGDDAKVSQVEFVQ